MGPAFSLQHYPLRSDSLGLVIFEGVLLSKALVIPTRERSEQGGIGFSRMRETRSRTYAFAPLWTPTVVQVLSSA
jgi:hypothetical protein